MSELKKIKEKFLLKIQSKLNPSEINQIKTDLFGKEGLITSQFKKPKKQNNIKDPNITDLEKELSDKIGLKTSIQFSEGGSSGSLTLYYSDLNQLDDIMKRLKK